MDKKPLGEGVEIAVISGALTGGISLGSNKLA